MEPQLETYSSNPKHKKEVCLYWLRNRCAKDKNCEFLHTMDYDKMPTCPMGDSCDARLKCPFKHLDDTRPLCANYQVGFCSFGRRCKHRHVQEHTVPKVNPFWTSEYSAIKRNESMAQSNKDFRKKGCEYYLNNAWCPYFDMCNFKH